MAVTLTRKLGLKKPAVTDMYDLQTWNDNMDIIEQLLAPVRDRTDDYSISSTVQSGDYYTTVEIRRGDGSLYMKSVLSDLVNGLFTTQTLVIYDLDGLTVLRTIAWTLTYDQDGNIITRVLN